MKIDHPEKRLKQFWGRVDKKHIESFFPYLTGNNVLDMGCGLGTTTDYLSKKGFNCVGIDLDVSSIDFCRKAFPGSTFQVANAEQLPFGDESFDTIILRDALHHFYVEADFEKVKKEILRVAKSKARIIFFDPNVSVMLRTMRWVAQHKDQECTYETASQIMREMGCKIIHHDFNTVYSLPLSGGYVGFSFVPNIGWIQDVVLGSERIFEQAISKLGIGRHLCWRYLIVGQKG